MRVAMLVNILSPYRIPLFEELQRTAGWEFQVYTCARSEHDRAWNVADDSINHRRTRSWAFQRTVRSARPS